MRQMIPDYSNSLVELGKALNGENSRFTLEKDKRLVLLVDGMGWFTFTSNLEGKFDSKRINTVFPSDTGTAITSLLTGLTPGEHGALGYYTYIPDLGLVEVIRGAHPSHTGIYKVDMASYFRLPKRRPTALMPDTFRAFEGYGRFVFSHVGRYYNLWHALKLVREMADRLTDYIFLYTPIIDELSHAYGPGDWTVKSTMEELGRFMTALRQLTQEFDVIVTADHGHITKEKSVTMNLEGVSAPPSGNHRVLFLRGEMEGREGYLSSTSLIADGVFGNFDERFRKRVGDFVLLPQGPVTVTYQFSPDDDGKNHVGVHGGLEREELEVPLIRL